MSDANVPGDSTVGTSNPGGCSEDLPRPSSPLRYRPERLHAKGGLGEVWLAHDEELHRDVALKRIQERFGNDPESRRRFLLEAEITGRLEHPGIVPVYGLRQGEDGQPWYAMRFIRGETLKDAIEHFHEAGNARRDPGERSVEFRQLLSRFVAVCNTVAYAHSRGILHRDLKPANIMLGKYGETLVVDWGLAKPFDRTETAQATGEDTLAPAGVSGEGSTLAGQVLGTPAYMSPEQAASRWAAMGPASDVYSLGATLYTILTGRAPFEGRTDEILARVQVGRFTPPEQVKRQTPRALAAICRKAMALQAADRYATALELAAEIERWLADQPVGAYLESTIEKVQRAGRRRPILTALLGLFAVGDVMIFGSLATALVWPDQLGNATVLGVVVLAVCCMGAALLMQVTALLGGLIGLAVGLVRRGRLRSWMASGARLGLLAGFPVGTLFVWASFGAQFAGGLPRDEFVAGRMLIECAVVVGMAGPLAGALLGALTALRRGWWSGLVPGALVGSVAGLAVGCLLFLVGMTHIQTSLSQQAIASTLNHSPDGKRLVSVTRDGKVALWDAETGEPIWAVEGHPRAYGTPAAFSADGRHVATAGEDGGIRVWDAQSGQPVLAFQGQRDAVRELLFSKDGQRLAVAVQGGTVRVWDIQTGQQTHSIASQFGPFARPAFSPDGQRLAVYERDSVKIVRGLWDR